MARSISVLCGCQFESQMLHFECGRPRWSLPLALTGTTLAIAALWEINQQVEDFALSLCLFLSVSLSLSLCNSAFPITLKIIRLFIEKADWQSKGETKRLKENIHLLVSSSNICNSQNWISWKPGARNSICVSQGDGKALCTWGDFSTTCPGTWVET